RVRLSARLRRPAHRGTTGRDCRCAGSLRAAPLSRKPVLYRRTGVGPRRVCATGSVREARTSPMNVPRQLALALPHAENFAREDFLAGASNKAAFGLIER